MLFWNSLAFSMIQRMLEAAIVRYMCAQSCLSLCDPWTAACQAPLSMGFPRREYWSGLPFPSPGDLPDPGIEPGSPALQVDSYQLSNRDPLTKANNKEVLK